MKTLRWALAALLAMALVVVGTVALAYPVTESEAKAAFERGGCTTCHNGAVAPDWPGLLKKISEWASKYGSIDEAVKAEYTYAGGAPDLAGLMKQKKSLSPGLSDADAKLLYEFFKEYFEKAKAAGPAKPTATPTTTAKPTTTPAGPAVPPGATAVVTVTVTPAGARAAAALAYANLAASIAVLVAAIIVGYLYYKARKPVH